VREEGRQSPVAESPSDAGSEGLIQDHKDSQPSEKSNEDE